MSPSDHPRARAGGGALGGGRRTGVSGRRRERDHTRPGGRGSPSRRSSTLQAGARVSRTELPGSFNRTKIDSTADLPAEFRDAGAVPYGDGRQDAWMVDSALAFGDIADPAQAQRVTVDVDVSAAPDFEDLVHHDGQLELLRCSDVVTQLTGNHYRHAVCPQRTVSLDEFYLDEDHCVPLKAIYQADAHLVGENDQIVWEHKRRPVHRGDDFAHRQVILPMLGEAARAASTGRPALVRGIFSLAVEPLEWIIQEMAYDDGRLSRARTVQSWSVRFHLH